MLNDAMMNESVIDKNTSRTESLDSDKLLEIAIKRRLEELFPLIAFFIITSFFGIIGNSLTIRFYGFKAKRNTPFVLIALLSAFDIIVCFVCFGHIVATCVYVVVTYKHICQVGYFIINWFVRSSTLALCVIAIERYRHVCKSGQKQLTVKFALKIVIGMSVVSMIYSTHTFVTYDSVKVNMWPSDEKISNVSLHSCKNTEDPALRCVLTAFHTIDILYFSAVSATLFYTYGMIWWKNHTHNKKTAYLHNKPIVSSQQLARSQEVHQNDADNRKEKSGQLRSDATVNVDLDKESTETLHLTTVVKATCSPGAESQTAASNYSAKDQKSIETSKISQSERNITKLMFFIIVGFFICFIPFLLVQVIIASVAEFERNIWTKFALRFPFVNSMINPIICLAFHKDFRLNLKGILTKSKP